MKKYLPYIIIGVVVLAAGIGGFFAVKSILKPKKAVKTKIAEKVNTVPVSDRPYVTLSPTSGKHPAGTEVEVIVHTSTLDSTEAEYELEYQAGSLLQGAFGSMDFLSEKPPVSKTLLLGTCSAGGACSYNEDVSGGTILVRLDGGQEKFAVKGEWSYQRAGERDGKFSSRDSKFRIDLGAKSLPASSYVIVTQTMGLPEMPEEDIIAGPYHVSTGSKANLKIAEITWRLTNAPEEVTLLGWTGKTWKQYKSSLKDSSLTGSVDMLTTYLVVASNPTN